MPEAWGMKKYLSLALGALLLAGGHAVAGSPFQSGSQTATFTETEKGKTSTGSLTVGPSGKIRWERLTPFREIVISNGKEAWHVDYDLKQAVRLNGESINNWATLLNGVSNDQYAQTRSGNRVRLIPKTGQALPAMDLTLDAKGRPSTILVGGAKPYAVTISGWKSAPGASYDFRPPGGFDILGQ